VARTTHDNTSNALGRIAVALQVLRHGDEDAGGKSHVEHPVRFLATLLKLLHMFLELNERIILIVLAGDVGAEAAELLQLLLDFLRRCLDVGLDAAKVLFVIHLRPGITHDLDIFGKEVVSVLSCVNTRRGLRDDWYLQGRRERGTEIKLDWVAETLLIG
jgi:hypothetical protein